MLELLADLGADVEWTAPNEVRVHAADVAKHELDPELCEPHPRVVPARRPAARALRARATCRRPGGDVIGRRRLDPHIHAFAELGAEIDVERRATSMRTDGLRGARVFLDEASVMATENAVMAAVARARARR